MLNSIEHPPSQQPQQATNQLVSRIRQMGDSTLVEGLSSVKLSNSERRRSVSEEFKNLNSRIEPIKEEDSNCIFSEDSQSMSTIGSNQTNGEEIHQKTEPNCFISDPHFNETNFHHKISHDYFETSNNEKQQFQQDTRLVKQMKASSTASVDIPQDSAQSIICGMAQSIRGRPTVDLPSNHRDRTPSPNFVEINDQVFSGGQDSCKQLLDSKMVSSSSPNSHHQPLRQQDSEPMILDDLDEEQLKRYLAYKRLSEGCNRLNTTFTRKNSLHIVDGLPPLTEGEPMKHMSYHMSQNIESTASSSSSSSVKSNRQQTIRDIALKRGSQDENTSCSSSTSLERSPGRRRSSTVSQCSSVLSEGTRNQLNFDLSPDLPMDSSILEANAISPTDLDRPASPEPLSLSGDSFDFRPMSRLSNEEPIMASPDSTLGDSNDEISEEKLKQLTGR